MGHPTRRVDTVQASVRSNRDVASQVAEKDETEIRLEKMLFGDEAGFLSALTTTGSLAEGQLARIGQDDTSDMDVDGVDEEGEDALDEELFFLDAGQSTLPSTISEALKEANGQDEQDEDRRPVWHDSDDECITVSLATNTRLRKLRETETDDLISGTEYIRRLRQQYKRLHPTPSWVLYARKKRRISTDNQLSDSDSDVSVDDDELTPQILPLPDLLRSVGGLVRSEPSSTIGLRQRRLQPEVLDIQRLKDITGAGPSSIDTMQFHPQHPLLLTGGPSSTINLYHVSPQPPNPNPLVTSLHLKNTPLHTAAFCQSDRSDQQIDGTVDRTRIFVSSRRRHFHTWSLATGTIQKVSRPIYGSGRHESKTMETFKLSPDGRYMGLVGSGKKGGGTINVLSTESMQWICACRIDSDGGVADFSWWRDSRGFAVAGKNGEVSEYDVERMCVVRRWLDEGAVGTTTISLGGQIARPDLGGNRWVAVGSSSGIVNLYDRREWVNEPETSSVSPQRPKPTRVFDQLTTPTSYLDFAADGQMMVMGSRWKKDALRLVHLPSCTVYRNWPTDQTPLGRISSVALNVDGEYLAVANEQGKVRLFQIRE